MRDPSMMEAYLALREWWLKTGVSVPTEALSDARIAALEDRYHLKLPLDFRAYLASSCPIEENWDDEMGNWWPLARIRNIPEEYPHSLTSPLAKPSKYLFFLDHCIWCWAWAISCADDDTYGSIVLVGGADRTVSGSFSEFIGRYTSDWIAVS